MNFAPQPLSIAIALFLAIISAFAESTHAFRNADWGMTSEQVLATEAQHPVNTQKSGAELTVSFDLPKDADLPGSLAYSFVNNRLVRARYILAAQHEDRNDYISDFAAIESQLEEKYGKRSADRAIWLSDAGQLERLPYLEQDRAHATDILPSDVNVGLSVSMGFLKMYTERSSGNTRIIHALTGGDSKVVHQIEYRAVSAPDLN